MPGPVAQTDLSEIAKRIVVVRGQRVLLDADLASLYGVTPKRLNEQVRRNLKRFPPDFLITLEINELRNLRSQFATSSWGGRRYRVLAFTEHGAFMAANVLNSQRATEMSIYVVRAFVKLREILASNENLARKLRQLEKSLTTMDVRTRRQFEEVYAAFRALMAPPAGGIAAAPRGKHRAACRRCNQVRHRRKVAPDPQQYRRDVQRRVGRGKWHDRCVHEAGLIS